MDKSITHELFRRHTDNSILPARDWFYLANSVFKAAARLNGVFDFLIKFPSYGREKQRRQSTGLEGLFNYAA